MRQMISPGGVRVDMCCASCGHLGFKTYGPGMRGIKPWCKKKGEPVLFKGSCSRYAASEFFRGRGYKEIED